MNDIHPGAMPGKKEGSEMIEDEEKKNEKERKYEVPDRMKVLDAMSTMIDILRYMDRSEGIFDVDENIDDVSDDHFDCSESVYSDEFREDNV